MVKDTKLTNFRHVESSLKVKLLTTIYLIYQLICEYNFKNIFVKMEKNKMYEIFENEVQCFPRKNGNINFES